MKKLFFISITFLLVSSSYAGESNQKIIILNMFINAHNLGTEKAILEFIKETYNPDLYHKIDKKKHIAFYSTIIKEFGPLNTAIYKKVEEKPLKLIVHLIKQDENSLNRNINPAEILVVELDLNEGNSKYLARGLGLGALVCELRKE